MTNQKDLEKSLTDRLAGKMYDHYNIGSGITAVVRELLGMSDNPSPRISYNHDHSTIDLLVSDYTTGIRSTFASVTVKKKKGETHYSRWGGNYTDYTIASFEVWLSHPTLEESFAEAVKAVSDAIDKKKTDRLDRIVKAKEIMKMFDWKSYELREWCSQFTKDFYNLNLD